MLTSTFLPAAILGGAPTKCCTCILRIRSTRYLCTLPILIGASLAFSCLQFHSIEHILQFYFCPLAFRYFSFRSHLVTVTMNLVLCSCRPPACDLFSRNISCAKKIKKTWVKKSGSMNEYFKDFVCWTNDRGFHS